MSGDRDLQKMIAGVRAFGRTGLTEAAREARPLVEAEARATAAAGTTPSGAAWQPKKGGGAPLEHAAEHVTVTQAGPTLRVTLAGPEVFHNYGARGGKLPKRQIIPDGVEGTPPVIVAALKEGARRAFSRLVGGGR